MTTQVEGSWHYLTFLAILVISIIVAVNGTTMQFHTDAGGNPLTFDLQIQQFTSGLQGEVTTLKQN